MDISIEPLVSQVGHYFEREAFDLLYTVRPAGNHELQREMRYAYFTVGVERFYQLLRGTAQVAFILEDWLARHLDLTTTGEEYLLGVAPTFGSQTLNVLKSSF